MVNFLKYCKNRHKIVKLSQYSVKLFQKLLNIPKNSQKFLQKLQKSPKNCKTHTIQCKTLTKIKKKNARKSLAQKISKIAKFSLYSVKFLKNCKYFLKNS